MGILRVCELLNKNVQVFLVFCYVVLEACENRFVVKLDLAVCLRAISCHSKMFNATSCAYQCKTSFRVLHAVIQLSVRRILEMSCGKIQ